MRDGKEGFKKKKKETGNHFSALHTTKSLTDIERLQLEILKRDIEIARLKKRVPGERSWCKQGVRYFKRQEFQIAHNLSFKHPITFTLSFVIKDWHRRFPSYGYHDIAAVMRKQSDLGIKFSDNLIHKCCKFLSIKSKVKHYSYKKSGTQSRIYPNIIMNQWKATQPLEIIGSALSRTTGDPKSYYKCLEDILALLKDNKKTAPTILPTDQGAVYHSKAFAKAHENYNIIRSMSRTRTPTDNPIIESLNGWIKAEMACDYQYWSVDNFENFIEEYVHYFNFERPAYCLNYKTPIQYKMDKGF